LSLAHNITCDNTLPSPPPIPKFYFLVTLNVFEKKGEGKPHKTPSLKEHSPKGGFRV